MILGLRDCLIGGGGADIGERSHRRASVFSFVRATSRTAATMLGYAPHRQMLPDIRSRISRSLNSIFEAATSFVTALGAPRRASSSIATAEQIWPDVQKPH